MFNRVMDFASGALHNFSAEEPEQDEDNGMLEDDEATEMCIDISRQPPNMYQSHYTSHLFQVPSNFGSSSC